MFGIRIYGSNCYSRYSWKIFDFKVIFLGDSGVGKTSIVLAHDGQPFNPHYTGTLGANFIVSTLKVGNAIVQLQLWDTAGQERFRSMLPMYMRNASAAMIVFDVTSEKSFESLHYWIEEVKKQEGLTDILILGNKTDLASLRKISPETAQAFAAHHGATYFETSAKDHLGIEKAIRVLSENLLMRKQTLPRRDSYIELMPNQEHVVEENEKKCC